MRSTGDAARRFGPTATQAIPKREAEQEAFRAKVADLYRRQFERDLKDKVADPDRPFARVYRP